MPTNKSYGERMYGSKAEKKAAAAKGRVFPGPDTLRGRSYTGSQVQDMKRDHDDILDPDGKVRRYKRDKPA